MFELLLQADRALAEGQLDRAEKTYWQLIELDPTNAIALAGLSRINLDRGDERLARTLAERALGMDPDSFVARRVLATIEKRGETPGPVEVDLTFLGAERLEALSRRRRQGDDTSDDGAPRSTGPTGPSIRKTAPARPGARRLGSGTAPPSRAAATHVTAEERERQKKGRIAAAAAAAGMAVREPAAPKAPKSRKSEPVDPFAAAEMAAAIEAVDEVDIELPEFSEPRAIEVEPPAEADAEPSESPNDSALDDVAAESSDASVALRLAMLGDLAEDEAAERPAELDPAELETAELAAAEAAAEVEPAGPTVELAVAEPPTEIEVAETSAEVEPAGPTVELAVVEPPVEFAAETEAAEPPAELAATETPVEAEPAAEPPTEAPAEALEVELEATEPPAELEAGVVEESEPEYSRSAEESEMRALRDAEMQAMREAVEDAGEDEPSDPEPRAADDRTEPAPTQEEPGGAWQPDEPDEPDGKKKKGFLGRFRG